MRTFLEHTFRHAHVRFLKMRILAQLICCLGVLTSLRDPPVLKMVANSLRGGKPLRQQQNAMETGSEVLAFLRKRNRKTVQIVKNYGGIVKHDGFKCRIILSTEGPLKAQRVKKFNLAWKLQSWPSAFPTKIGLWRVARLDGGNTALVLGF